MGKVSVYIGRDINLLQMNEDHRYGMMMYRAKLLKALDMAPLIAHTLQCVLHG